MVSWRKKIGVRGKNEKGERKKEENYIKKGKKALKNASFWASPRPTRTYLSGKKIES